MEKKKLKLRDANVEAFRCILMFIIVLYHCFVHGIFEESHAYWTVIFSSFLMWHVDGFVAISGWFGIRWSLGKFLQLFWTILFYSLLSFIYVAIFRRESLALRHVCVSAGWFGGTYLMLMMLAPLLNLCIEGLCRMSRVEILKGWGLFALAMFLTWVPRNLFTGVNASGAGGFSIIMMIFMYMTVRLIRLKDMPIKLKHVGIGVGTFFLGILSMGVLSVAVRLIKHHPIDGTCFRAFCSYNAPYVWLMAVSLMVCFGKSIHVPERVGKVVRFIGPSMFGIYLCHDTTSFGTLIYRIPETWLVQNTALHPVIIIPICAVGTFLACLSVDLLRRMGMKCLTSLGLKCGVNRLVGKVDDVINHCFN